MHRQKKMGKMPSKPVSVTIHNREEGKASTMSAQPYYNTGQNGLVVVQGTVVQGTDVNNNYKPPKNDVYKPDYSQQQVAYHEQPEVTHGVRQQKRCNDVFFAILFYAHLGVIAWITAVYAPAMAMDVADGVQDAYQNRFLDEDGGGNDGGDQDNGDGNGEIQFDMAALWLILGVSAVAGFIMSALFLSVMMRFAEGLIKFALWFNIITPLLMAILSLIAGAIPAALMFLLFAAFSAYYAYVCWGRIPFAAANMRTAVTAVKANFGLTFFAFNSLVLSFFWTLWWAIATVSTIYVTSGCTPEAGCETEPRGPLVFGLLLSYYWTVQVIKNVCHTTVCGTVGTWWFHPQEASSCCSKAVCDSFFRSITYSFGSICFGSLIVAIIQTIKEMARQAREQGDSALLCIAECILGCIESLVEYFNTWCVS
jgi:hypothetical protein